MSATVPSRRVRRRAKRLYYADARAQWRAHRRSTRAAHRDARAVPVLLSPILILATVAAAAFVVAAWAAIPVVPYDAAADVVSRWWASIPTLPETFDEPAERSVVVDADGGVLAVLHDDENRKWTEFGDIGRTTVQAVLATEDREFFEHQGYNAQSMVRAAVENFRAGSVTQGGSTLTQQLVKLLVVGNERTNTRKVAELKVAYELDKKHTKEEILTLYLNHVYFGNGTYGVGAASEYYFGETAATLNPAQAATLAGIIRTPTANDPVRHPDAARARRDIVLRQMAEVGYLTPREARMWAAMPLSLRITDLPETRYPFFVEQVKNEILSDPQFGADRRERAAVLFGGGLTVRTTLEPETQAHADAVLASRLTDPVTHPMGAIVTVVPGDGRVVAAAVGPKQFGPCDDVPDNCVTTTVNPVFPGLGGSGRQTGSAFKPFVSATALSHGITSSRGFTAGRTIPGCAGYSPTNYGGGYGGAANMYAASTVSNNIFFVRILGVLGPDPLLETARNMGITSDVPPVCPSALGAADVFPVDMASGFATLAAGGKHCRPYTVAEVTNRHGEQLGLSRPGCGQGLDAGVARRVNDTLRGVIGEGGTASGAGIGRPARGKTGTTQSHRDAWFVGYTAGADGDAPDTTGAAYSTAVWIGYEHPRPLVGVFGVPRMTGGSIPASLWSSYMRRITEGKPEADFVAPPSESVTVPSVTRVGVDAAAARAEETPLRPAAETVPGWFPRRTVLTQSPRSGSRAAYLSRLDMEVSDGRLRVPRVPVLVDLGQDDAAAELEAAGYFRRVAEVPVLDVELFGTVLDQEPGPYMIAEKGDTVTVHVAVDGRPRMPYVVGLPESEAMALLRGNDYEVVRQTEVVADGRGAGTVLRADVEAGVVHFPEDGPVTVVVAEDGRPVVPDVRGLPLDGARERLSADGLEFSVRVTEVPLLDSAQFGVVQSHDPGRGSRLVRGGTVTVAVGVDARVRVPDVTGLTRSEAVRAVTEAGLNVEETERAVTDAGVRGRVVEQQPRAGGGLVPGATVRIVVGVAPSPSPSPSPAESGREDSRAP